MGLARTTWRTTWLGQHHVTRTSQNYATGWYKHSRRYTRWTHESLASQSIFASRYLSEWYSGDHFDEYLSLSRLDRNASQLWWWHQKPVYLPLLGGSTVVFVFRYYLLGSDTSVPCGLYARLCHAFLVCALCTVIVCTIPYALLPID